MKKHFVQCLSMLLPAAMLFTGCGRTEDRSEENSAVQSNQSFLVTAGEYDYEGATVKEPGEVRMGEEYVIIKYMEQADADPEEWTEAAAVFDRDRSIRAEDVSMKFGEDSKLTYLAIPDGQDQRDVTEAMRSLTGGEMPNWINNVYRDEEGYYYIQTATHIYLMDGEGKPVAAHQIAVSETCFMGTPILSDTGKLIFCSMDSVSHMAEVFYFDTSSGKRKLITRFEDTYFRTPLCAFRGANLFYRSNQDLIRLDVNSGERERVIALGGLAKDNKISMGFTQKDEALLYASPEYRDPEEQTESEWIAMLGVESSLHSAEIRIDDLYNDWDNYMVSNAMTSFQAKYSELSIQYCAGNEKEEFRTRMLADLTNGQGADVLFVNRDDLYLLAKKGAIVDLTQMISGETLSELLPGAIELGTVDGQLMGIPPLVYIDFLCVSRKDWEKDHWSMEEFMEYTDQHQKKYAWINPVNGGDGFSHDYNLMSLAGLESLEGMGLIDFENGKAYLDDGRYEKLLEFCKTYGQTQALSEQELEQFIQNGDAAAYIQGGAFGFSAYENIAALLGEDLNPVGFPMGETSYNTLKPHKYLVVTKTAYENEDKRKAISTLIEYLLSEEQQRKISYNISVRIPALDQWEEIRKTDGQGNEIVLVKDADEKRRAKALKQDGSSYVEDFKSFLMNCRGVSYLPADVKKILREEYMPFFNGERDAETVAKYSQNRLQLFLDEQQ
ncbi:MAG: ABC transporter substrate-binding protein [Acetatifactor sp.]